VTNVFIDFDYIRLSRELRKNSLVKILMFIIKYSIRRVVINEVISKY
jgi:hypothetical protein